MDIRPYESKDLRECISLFINVFNNEPWNDKWTSEKAEQYLVDYIKTPGFSGFIAVEGMIMKGFIFGFRKRWWNGDEFFINEMCVQIDDQRSGVGSKLIHFLEIHLKSEGIESITLLTNRGIPAEKFYVKNGFKEIERLIFLYKNIK